MSIKELIYKAKMLQSTLPYIRQFYGKTFVIKYGGSAMTEESLRESFAKDILLLRYVGIKVIVVHGGGPQINKTLESFGIEITFVGGMRKTDEETMHIVEMVLAGDINKDIVALINKHSGEQVYAVGLSGRDGNLIKAKKLDKEECFKELGLEVPQEDIGFVGQVISINTHLLTTLMDNNYIPVIAPIGVGLHGEAYNINADVVASEVARYMRAEKLIFLTDTEGIKDQHGKVISSINKEEIYQLIKNGTIKGGMIPKVKSALKALQAGVKKVHIIDGRCPHSILLEVFTEEGIGTEIVG